jgi:bifunctional DNase/RNase
VFLIESRASDGIALAMACNTPIFMDTAIFDKLDEIRSEQTKTEHETLEKLSEETLNKLLARSIEEENYEHASQIRDELGKRKNTTEI